METQNTIPQPATDYLARLVDSRKRAYAADCVTRWESGQPFAASWPNLKAEYVDDIAKKLTRYLSPKGSKPVSAPSPVEKWVAEVVPTIEADPLAKAGYRQLPGTSIETYGLERGCYKISNRDESAAVKAGWPIERRGSHYAYVKAAAEPAAIIKCDECSQAIRTSEIIDGKCPNPACWKGYAAYCEAYRGWHAASEAFVKAHNAAGYGQAGRLAHNAWITRNREPKADDFRDGKRPTYPAWEVANVETKEQREARLLAEKWANPTIITLPHGEARILASVPEQQRLKIEAEIAKVVTARTLPDQRTYLRGKAYIGDVRGSVYDGRLVFTESIGGEKWTEAFKRQIEVAYAIGWYKKDGAKPGDYIPRDMSEHRAMATETYAEAAG